MSDVCRIILDTLPSYWYRVLFMGLEILYVVVWILGFVTFRFNYNMIFVHKHIESWGYLGYFTVTQVLAEFCG